MKRLRQSQATREATAVPNENYEAPPRTGAPSNNNGVDRVNNNTTEYLAGHVRSRTTTAGFLFRRWHTCYWLFQGPATILFFKSEDKMRNWTDTRNEAHVTLSVDFDTMRLLHSVDKARVKEIQSSTSNVKLLSRRMKYAFTEVHTKVYGKEVLYSFKLERWTDVGVDVVASFASALPMELIALRKVIQDCIQLTTPIRKKEKVQVRCSQSSHYRNGIGNDGDTLAMTETTATVASLELKTGRKRTGSSQGFMRM